MQLRKTLVALGIATLALVVPACAPRYHEPATEPVPTASEWVDEDEEPEEQPAPETSTSPAPSFPEDPPVGAGEAAVVTLTVGERERRFILSVPEGYSPRQSWPVIMAFPGMGETPETMRSYTGFDDATALVVYGEGVNKAWAPAPYASTSLAEDLAYTDAVLAKLAERYHLNPERIYATGFSNGGGFAATLSCHRPDTYAAVAPVGAAYYEPVFEDCTSAPMPYLDIHGTADQVIDYQGGSRHNTDYFSVQEVLDIMAQRNQCSGAASVSPETQHLLDIFYTDCAVPLEHVRGGGVGHHWPGATSQTAGSAPSGYTTYRILQFFDVDWLWPPKAISTEELPSV